MIRNGPGRYVMVTSGAGIFGIATVRRPPADGADLIFLPRLGYDMWLRDAGGRFAVPPSFQAARRLPPTHRFERLLELDWLLTPS